MFRITQTLKCCQLIILLALILPNISLATSTDVTLKKTYPHNTNRVLDVVVGLAKPPYVIPKDDKGYELELISAVFETMDISPRYIYVPLGRSVSLLDQGMGEALLTINKFIVPNDEIRTVPYITYKNVAISLKNKALKVNTIADLNNKKVAAFQYAHKYLGYEFSKVAAKNPSYIEVPNQFQQVQLLLEGRVDLLVMDINIFNHIYKTLIGQETTSEPNIHPIFPDSPYSVAFKDPNLVEIFNVAFKKYSLTKEYRSLKNRYEIYN